MREDRRRAKDRRPRYGLVRRPQVLPAHRSRQEINFETGSICPKKQRKRGRPEERRKPEDEKCVVDDMGSELAARRELPRPEMIRWPIAVSTCGMTLLALQ
jgi:hypothetical protein